MQTLSLSYVFFSVLSDGEAHFAFWSLYLSELSVLSEQCISLFLVYRIVPVELYMYLSTESMLGMVPGTGIMCFGHVTSSGL